MHDMHNFMHDNEHVFLTCYWVCIRVLVETERNVLKVLFSVNFGVCK